MFAYRYMCVYVCACAMHPRLLALKHCMCLFQEVVRYNDGEQGPWNQTVRVKNPEPSFYDLKQAPSPQDHLTEQLDSYSRSCVDLIKGSTRRAESSA